MTAAAAVSLIAATIASPSGAQTKRADVVDIVGYSTPKAAYTQLAEAFKKTPAGKDVDFTLSFGASGDQSRAVVAGQKADIVAFALAADVFPLVKAGLVANTWNKNPYNGMINTSAVSFLVRKGNPKHITGWGDLTRKDVQVLTPNPFTSGGARWNVIAAYGAKRRQGATDRQAIAYLGSLFRHVVAQDTSARNALTTFAQGKGDVMLGYENEAIFAEKQGVSSDYVIPQRTISIELPIALTTSGAQDPGARAFLNYLRTDEAQKIWAENGYRPIVKRVFNRYRKTFPTPAGMFTIRQLGLGGWAQVQKRFFDPSTGIMARIEKSIGG